jgi:hypothetical protein
MTDVTPNLIEVMIHCYVSPEPHPRYDTPAVSGAIRILLEHSLVQPKVGCANVFMATSRGTAWIEMLLATPLPHLAWVDASGRVIREADQ